MNRIEDTMYGVTPKGFRRKLYHEELADQIERARRVFGVNIDTSETSFLGQLIRNFSWDLTRIWEVVEDVYYTPFVNTAEGTALDNVGMYLTITRRPATKSKGIITVKGEDGVVIPKGFKISSKKGVVYETEESTVIKDGKAEIPIISIGAGKEYNVPKETLTEIMNPIIGVREVINVEETEGGLDLETDEEFRARYKKSYSRVGGSTVPAITAALLDIDRVVDAEVRENVTMVEIDGIPPKSIACFVYGGEDEEIAKAIYQNKAGGIQAFGEQYVDIKDKRGRIHKIGFTRAKTQEIYVDVELVPSEAYKDEEVLIRAILNYIGGVDKDGIEYAGLKLGRDVIHSRLVGAMMCLGNIEDVKVMIGTDPENLKEETIVMDKNTIAITDPEKIRISYVEL